MKSIIRKGLLYKSFFCAIVSFICITLNSKFSFLYKFHDVDDVYCFITTARCMLRGDVLYKDIYEHKGPYHYFLYCFGLIFSDKTLTGVYLIELVLFACFAYIVLKTMQLFCQKGFLSYIVTALIAVSATVTRAFAAGGECEELSLVFVAFAFYAAIKRHFRKITEIESNSLVLLIGISFALVFWSKYTLTGAFAGYCVSILVEGSIKKDLKFVVNSAKWFLIGTAIGSLPIILYFAVNGAIKDVWQVYFYNLMFRYSENTFGVKELFNNLCGIVNIPIIVIFVGIILAPGKMINKYCKIIIPIMVGCHIIGLTFGKVWSYSHETKYSFVMFSYIGILGIISRLLQVKAINEHVDAIRHWIKKFLSQMIEKESENKTSYLLKIKKYFDGLKNTYNEIRTPKMMIGYVVFAMLLIMYMSYFVYTVSYYTPDIGEQSDNKRLEISQYILKKVPNDPVIVCFSQLDPGLYYFTGAYPPDKYFCQYNLFSLEELRYYDKYIKTGKADFVFSHNLVDNLENYGYKQVYGNLEFSGDSGEVDLPEYNLYIRSDLL